MSQDKKQPRSAGRIIALDYLRGFFIVVIIIDHLWRWPNIFQYMTGRGELWVSAAEGFVMISGMLVGYIHGYKKRQLPLSGIAAKLIQRGLMLYIWMCITTVFLVATTWYAQFKGNVAHVPIPVGDWQALLHQIIKLDYVHTLTHFLYLYAIFLVAAPCVLWLLRRNKKWLVVALSAVFWFIGFQTSIEWLQWQVLFFIPSVFGYYFDTAFAWYRSRTPKARLALRLVPIFILAITFLTSLVAVLPHEPGTYIHAVFNRRPLLTLPTILLSFVWFFGLLSLFQYIMPFLKKSFSWLLPLFGERSLTAYILHTIPLVICQMLFASSTNFWVNTLLTISCVIGTWILLKIPFINKLIPR